MKTFIVGEINRNYVDGHSAYVTIIIDDKEFNDIVVNAPAKRFHTKEINKEYFIKKVNKTCILSDNAYVYTNGNRIKIRNTCESITSELCFESYFEENIKNNEVYFAKQYNKEIVVCREKDVYTLCKMNGEVRKVTLDNIPIDLCNFLNDHKQNFDLFVERLNCKDLEIYAITKYGEIKIYDKNCNDSYYYFLHPLKCVIGGNANELYSTLVILDKLELSSDTKIKKLIYHNCIEKYESNGYKLSINDVELGYKSNVPLVSMFNNQAEISINNVIAEFSRSNDFNYMNIENVIINNKTCNCFNNCHIKKLTINNKQGKCDSSLNYSIIDDTIINEDTEFYNCFNKATLGQINNYDNELEVDNSFNESNMEVCNINDNIRIRCSFNKTNFKFSKNNDYIIDIQNKEDNIIDIPSEIVEIKSPIGCNMYDIDTKIEINDNNVVKLPHNFLSTHLSRYDTNWFKNITVFESNICNKCNIKRLIIRDNIKKIESNAIYMYCNIEELYVSGNIDDISVDMINSDINNVKCLYTVKDSVAHKLIKEVDKVIVFNTEHELWSAEAGLDDKDRLKIDMLSQLIDIDIKNCVEDSYIKMGYEYISRYSEECNKEIETSLILDTSNLSINGNIEAIKLENKFITLCNFFSKFGTNVLKYDNKLNKYNNENCHNNYRVDTIYYDDNCSIEYWGYYSRYEEFKKANIVITIANNVVLKCAYFGFIDINNNNNIKNSDIIASIGRDNYISSLDYEFGKNIINGIEFKRGYAIKSEDDNIFEGIRQNFVKIGRDREDSIDNVLILNTQSQKVLKLNNEYKIVREYQFDDLYNNYETLKLLKEMFSKYAMKYKDITFENVCYNENWHKNRVVRYKKTYNSQKLMNIDELKEMLNSEFYRKCTNSIAYMALLGVEPDMMQIKGTNSFLITYAINNIYFQGIIQATTDKKANDVLYCTYVKPSKIINIMNKVQEKCYKPMHYVNYDILNMDDFVHVLTTKWSKMYEIYMQKETEEIYLIKDNEVMLRFTNLEYAFDIAMYREDCIDLTALDELSDYMKCNYAGQCIDKSKKVVALQNSIYKQLLIGVYNKIELY